MNGASKRAATPFTERVLLAIDTSIGTSVALSAGGELFEARHDDARGHTEAIGGLIARMFEHRGVSPALVEGVVVGIGPGPFTGLRVGIAAAKAFATGIGVPLLPLSGHEAAALEAILDETTRTAGGGEGAADGEKRPPEPLRPRDPATASSPQNDGAVVRVVQDARRRELFVTEYAGLDALGLPVRSAEARLLARADYAEEPGDVWPERISASNLLRLAQLRLSAGRGFEPDRALYLRSPDVFPSAAPKRVST